MRDAYQVLYEKETDLARVRQEIESLKIVACLLGDDASVDGSGEIADDDIGKKPAGYAEDGTAFRPASEITQTIGAFSVGQRSGFWSSFRRRG